MYILSYFKEYTCHSCILADRHVLVICNIKILNNIVKDTLGNLSVFACAACFDGAFYVFRKMFICFDTEFFDDICKSAYFYFTHSGKLPSFIWGYSPGGDISHPFCIISKAPGTGNPLSIPGALFYILSILLALFVTSVFWKQ